MSIVSCGETFEQYEGSLDKAAYIYLKYPLDKIGIMRLQVNLCLRNFTINFLSDLCVAAIFDAKYWIICREAN